MSLALPWPLGFKVDKMWFSVLKGKKGRELTPKCLPCVRSFAHVTFDNRVKYYHQSPAVPEIPAYRKKS